MKNTKVPKRNVKAEANATAPNAIQIRSLLLGTNIFHCEICRKCFTKCKYFRRNKSLHKKRKTLKCDLCHVSFMFSYQLQSHRLTHTYGHKPFRFGICKKAFTCKYYLKQHEWIHNPASPFKCRICGKGYTSEGYFKRHELTHTQ